MTYSKERAAEWMREWRRKNAEYYKSWRKDNYEKRKDEINARRGSPEAKARRANRVREYRKRNPEKDKASRQAWRAVNKDKLKVIQDRCREKHLAEYRERDRKYHREHREHRVAMARKYYAENKERLLDSVHRYYQDHREETIAQKRAWRAANRARSRKKSRDRDARKAAARGKHTFEQWMCRVVYYGWMCVYCGKSLTDQTLSQDHAIPLCRGGTNFASNLLPACKRCNTSKGKKTFAEYMKVLSVRG